jgi:high-affinity nickel permease
MLQASYYSHSITSVSDSLIYLIGFIKFLGGADTKLFCAFRFWLRLNHFKNHFTYASQGTSA